LHSLDLCGGPGSGGISQTFATDISQAYEVRFSMSGNPLTGYPGDDQPNKTLRVQVGDQFEDFSFDVDAEQNSLGDMKWKPCTFTFVADSDSTTLEIFSTMDSASYVGTVIDNVQVFKIASPYQYSINGELVEQQLGYSGQGHTVIRLWGSYYEMGYAHAHLLGDYIVDGVYQTKAILGGGAYDDMRQVMAQAIWMPSTIEDELDGMVDSLASTHPEAGIDKLALKVFNTLGDWAYACRSHICWGRYVAEPIKTLATRRLDFPTIIPLVNCHVLCAYDPNDGSPRWVNMTWPGLVTVATGLNEYGTIVSSHNYQSHITDLAAGRIPRLVAFRHALTFATDPDASAHLDTVFAELQNYEVMTATFLNYYAPEGHCGVMVCNPNRADADFYYLRRPQPSWHHGEAIITTNDWTDGTFTPADEDFGADAYYNDESPKTHESHWHLVDPVTVNHGLHRLSVAYRGRRDMTVWADGRLDGIGRTPRLEYEWSDLFDRGFKYSKYRGSSGTAEDPYQIATAQDLIKLGETPEDYDKHFILTADIDLDPNLDGRRVFAKAVVGEFSGVFDGNGYTISYLTIRGDSCLGLFGQLGPGATISNLVLEAADIKGSGGYVGGERVGSLAGHNGGSITSCYSTGSVTGDRLVGGLVGSNDGSITASCSTGTARGGRDVGGLVGDNGGSITNCYSSGTVDGGWDVGGLVGENNGSIANCYSTGVVTGVEEIGGLVGEGGGSITSSFWDIETSGQTTSDGGVGKATAEMQTASTFLDSGWDFVDEMTNGTEDIWWILEGRDYPRLWWETE
jgi:hypothetical protein